MTSLLAIDPGKTTGLAWCDSVAVVGGKIDERIGELIRHREITGPLPDQVERILRGAKKMDTRVIVYESFQLRPGLILKDAGALAPLKIGAMLVSGVAGGPYGEGVWLYSQTASQGKSIFTDDRLRRLGCWWVGEEHARDATRHLLTFLRRIRSGKIALPEEVWA